MKFGIVGCGKIGKRHAEHIQKRGVLLAVCDIVPESANNLALEYNANAYYSIDDLLTAEKEIQVIAVCTPNGLHAEHSIRSLNAGLNVLCEKPMALHVEDCKKMISAAASAKKN